MRSTVVVLVLIVATASAYFRDAPWHSPQLAQRSLTHSSEVTGKPDKTGNNVSGTDTCSEIFSCFDCNTAKICRPTGSGGFVEVKRVTCPSTAPYCDFQTGTCKSTPHDNCGETDKEFLCLQDGIFPDYSNSKLYHVCYDHKATKFECKLPGENFIAVISSCDVSASFKPFTCTKGGVKVPYRYQSSYFGYCSKAGEQPTVVDKCPGSYQLNVTSQECEAICNKPGVLPDYDDCSKYYKCHYIWIPGKKRYLMRTLESCPPHTTFSPDDYVCVDENTNHHCPKH